MRKALTIFIFAMSAFFIGEKAQASETIVKDNAEMTIFNITNYPILANNGVIQEFEFDEDTLISGVYIGEGQGTISSFNSDIYLCRGSNIAGTGTTTSQCGNNTLIDISENCSFSGALAFTKCQFPNSHLIAEDTKYYISIFNKESVDRATAFMLSNNYWFNEAYDFFPDEFREQPENYDIAFKIYYDDTIPTEEQEDLEAPPDEFVYDYTLSPDEPDINTINSLSCLVGHECRVWFSFNNLADGGLVYLLEEGGTSTPAYAIASTTLDKDDGFNYWSYFDIPTATTTGEAGYELLLVKNSNWYFEGIFNIYWLPENYFENLFASYTIDHICDDVATSTGIFDEFRYGIECGLRKIFSWAFVPSSAGMLVLSEQLQAMNQEFPLTVLNQFTNALNSMNNASSSVATLPIAGLDSGTSLDNLNGLDLMPLDELDTSSVQPLIVKVREILVFILWIIMFAYFVYRIISMAGYSMDYFIRTEGDEDEYDIETDKRLVHLKNHSKAIKERKSNVVSYSEYLRRYGKKYR